MARGVELKGVILIDSPCSLAPPILSDAIINYVLCDQDRTVDASSTALVVRQFKQNTALLDKYAPGDGTRLSVPLGFLRCTAGFSPHAISADDVPAWFRDRNNDTITSIVRPWQNLVEGPIPVWDIPGHHFEPFSSVHVRRRFHKCGCGC